MKDCCAKRPDLFVKHTIELDGEVAIVGENLDGKSNLFFALHLICDSRAITSPSPAWLAAGFQRSSKSWTLPRWRP